MDNPFKSNLRSRKFLSDIVNKFRLTISLLKDERVPIWLKAIPIASWVYLIMPLDLLIGPIEDALVVYIGMDLFIDLCPPEVVDEHLQKLHGQAAPHKESNVVDVEFKEK